MSTASMQSAVVYLIFSLGVNGYIYKYTRNTSELSNIARPLYRIFLLLVTIVFLLISVLAISKEISLGLAEAGFLSVSFAFALDSFTVNYPGKGLAILQGLVLILATNPVNDTAAAVTISSIICTIAFICQAIGTRPILTNSEETVAADKEPLLLQSDYNTNVSFSLNLDNSAIFL